MAVVYQLALPVALTAILILYIPAYSVRESPSWTFVTAFMLVFFLRLFYSIILYPNFFTPFRNIPCPPDRSIWTGHSASFDDTPGITSAKWAREVPNDGILRYYLFLNQERLSPVSPKAIADVLVHKAYDWEKGPILNFAFGKVTGKGILLAEGDEHKRQRKHLNPAFSFRHVKNLYPLFWNKSVELARGIEKAVGSLPDDKEVIVIGHWARRVTLDIIGLAGMGHDFNYLTGESPLQRAYEQLLTMPPFHVIIVRIIAHFTVPSLSDLFPFKYDREVKKNCKAIRDLSQELLEEKREKLQSSKPDSDHTDIISVALESGGFTDESLANQIMTFLAAGHETTSSALQFAIHALCKDKDIQTKLRAEIRSNLPSISSAGVPPITAAQIDSLPYLNAVCSEVFRYYPTLPLTFRQACRDTTILDTFIPKGTQIVLSPIAANRSPELWGPDAGEFNPERWMGPGRANTGGAENNYAFMTFLHGPRSCIGSGFARAELACLLAVLVGRFEFELEEPEKELELKEMIVVSPKDGVRARVKVVEGW